MPYTAPPEAFAWPDYVNDQRRAAGLAGIDLKHPKSHEPAERAACILDSAIRLALAEGLDPDALAGMLAGAVAQPRPLHTAETGRLMLRVLAYGAARGLRLDVSAQETLQHSETARGLATLPLRPIPVLAPATVPDMEPASLLPPSHAVDEALPGCN